jgi:phospholipase D1/2
VRNYGAFEDAKEGVQHAQENIQTRIDNSQEAPPSQTTEAVPQPAPQDPSQTVHNPYHSFAPQRHQNHAKYYVDGCSYFWAMSVALEQAQKEIWIMDWWLSPELYLRRPPSANEPYRLDNMLKAAAERGVRVNLMIYKEVSKVLTREFLSAMHYPPPRSTIRLIPLDSQLRIHQASSGGSSPKHCW